MGNDYICRSHGYIGACLCLPSDNVRAIEQEVSDRNPVTYVFQSTVGSSSSLAVVAKIG